MKKTIAMFILGSLFGGLSTSKYFKKKYEKKNKEDIASIKKAFKNLEKKAENAKHDFVPEQSDDEPKPTEINEYQDIINKMDYSKITKEQKEEVEPMMTQPSNEPFVISPDDFGDYDDYDTVSWTYYADNMLADEDDYLVDDIEGTVGYDSLQHFGEYEDDSVFVRNHDKKCDYEILLDTRNYTDIVHDNT